MKTIDQKNLIWFRNDLRLHDNTALYQACQTTINKVIALFIDTPLQWKQHYTSSKKLSFLYHHIHSLKKELFKLNIPFYYYTSTNFLSSIEYLIYFCSKNNVKHLFYNYQYEINEYKRDLLVKKTLSQKGVIVQGYHDSILMQNNIIQSNRCSTYKNFSFFKKKIIQRLFDKLPKSFSIPKKRKCDQHEVCNSTQLKNFSLHFNTQIFPIGEKKAIDKLCNFFTYKFHNYLENRNFPYLNNTSMLSPYFSLGVISVRYCIEIFLNQKQQKLSDMIHSSWFNQILWREFYYHLLIGFPELSQSKALIPWEEKINWVYNIKNLNAWKEGNTGFPIVDAGMRQLNKIGWMHNRLRMITASFLVKNLLIDWREGEKYFISKLIDGDFALNNGGWQWSASVGTDSVSYTRILNPYNQSKTFDQYGNFIKKFIPELKDVPNCYIHQPHEWSRKNYCKINYPEPIINYQESRKKFLLTIHKAKLNFSKKRLKDL